MIAELITKLQSYSGAQDTEFDEAFKEFGQKDKSYTDGEHAAQQVLKYLSEILARQRCKTHEAAKIAEQDATFAEIGKIK